MKIEKVSDNQIRCTLNKADMEEYHLKLSELAYGTDKAKALFRDMMTKANYEFGFSAEDIPLMIEAIPLSAECIILVITKVECPEELDTRFSRFTPSPEEEEEEPLDVSNFLESASDILDLFEKISKPKEAKEESATPAMPASTDNSEFVPLSDALERISKAKKKVQDIKDNLNASGSESGKEESKTIDIDLTKLYVFNDLEVITKIAKILTGLYDGKNSLYKDASDGCYYLFLAKSNLSPEDFNKTCNIFSEYAKQSTYSPAVKAYFDEHCDLILGGNALQVMATL